MFKELAGLAGLMKQLPRLREEVEGFQQRLGQITAEGDAGGGMVKVRANGKFEILSCTIADEALKSSDRELLEDLIVAAANQALSKVRQQTAEEAGKLTSAMGLPAGLSLPGMPGG